MGERRIAHGKQPRGWRRVAAKIAVNYQGTYATIRAFVPVLEANGDGHVVDVLSLLSLAPPRRWPPTPPPRRPRTRSPSRFDRCNRARGITVHGVYPAGIDIDMPAGIDVPKVPPADVAARLLDGLAADREDVFPHPGCRGDFRDVVERTQGVRTRLLGRCSGMTAASPDR